MKQTHKIDIVKILAPLASEPYVILKQSEIFPKYYPQSDIDILAADYLSFTQKLLASLNQLVETGRKVSVTTYEDRKQVHVDIYLDNAVAELELRFDVIGQLPNYQKVDVKPGLKYSIINHRQMVKYGSSDLFFPSQVDDLIIRYLEYKEYYEIYPNKIKHLEFILQKLSDKPAARKFLDKLHMYTALRLLGESRESYLGLEAMAKLSKQMEALNRKVKTLSTSLEQQLTIQDNIQQQVNLLATEVTATRDNTQQLLKPEVFVLERLLTAPHKLSSKLAAKLRSLIK